MLERSQSRKVYRKIVVENAQPKVSRVSRLPQLCIRRIFMGIGIHPSSSIFFSCLCFFVDDVDMVAIVPNQNKNKDILKRLLFGESPAPVLPAEVMANKIILHCTHDKRQAPAKLTKISRQGVHIFAL